ncbi:hypothetical protein, partial [Paenibacillus sp. FSL H8-0548]|uniref:hypothetical protein n=1 Tax=Paenibacillus sp. FSL H8-0548 TaxID=1920422 RepID=UPI001C4B90B5
YLEQFSHIGFSVIALDKSDFCLCNASELISKQRALYHTADNPWDFRCQQRALFLCKYRKV